MKKIMTMIAFLSAGSLFAQEANSAKIMSAMHMPMMKTPFVIGLDPDVSFLSNMIPHHQGAVDSAKMMLQFTKNKEILTISSNIIKTQEAEIKDFISLIETLKAEKKSLKSINIKNYDKEAQDIMYTMMNSMMRDFKATGAVDQDFLSSMIVHHQGAVEASKQILKYTQDGRIKKIAEAIIAAQETEIKQFQAILAR